MKVPRGFESHPLRRIERPFERPGCPEISSKLILPLLIPFQGPSGSKENFGDEYLIGQRSFRLLNNSSKAKVTVNYESLLGKKFTSKILITQHGDYEYRIEPIQIG